MAQQLLHLVFGGELDDPRGGRFADPDALDIVGIFANYASAHDAAQGSVDDAHRRYFIVHLHRFLEPTEEREAS